MSVTAFDLPPPSSWQAFEALCFDLFSSDWNINNANRIGRNGQKQFGVDIVAQVADGWAGIQCKQTTRGGELKPADLADIVSEASKFEPALVRLVIATTTPNDEPLQREARRLDEANRNAGRFAVEIAGWGDLLARLDRHPSVIKRHYAALAQLGQERSPATDFQSRIDRFVLQYLGDETTPAPFVGRARELADLDEWLGQREKPYKLIRAGAGRGKSGLIVNWLSTLEHAVAVVHMPISARYRTNLAQVALNSLLVRLSALHGRPLPEGLDIDVERVKSLIADLLATPLPGDVPLLVAIDGLDEAADFEVTADIFPAKPPHGLKVLLAGRPVRGDDPLALLGAAPTDLRLLSDAEVYDGLRAFGVDSMLADRIKTLVDGDPVVLRLYWDSVREGGLTLETLSGYAPGVEGFIGRWWTDQKALWSGLDSQTLDLIESLTCVLSCALGPLSRSDLASPHLNPTPVILLQLDAALDGLSRLVVGKGKINDIVFAHPRLADFFREEWMPTARRAEIEARLIDWGEDALRSLEADSPMISPHLVSHLGAYFERSKVGQARLAPLTTRAWADQCYALDPSLAGFLTDVGRRRRAAARDFQNIREREAALAALAHCALTTATVRTLANGMDQYVLIAALRLGIWSAEVVFSQITTVRNLTLEPKLLAEVAVALGKERAGEVLTLALTSEKRQRLGITGALLPVLPPKERDLAAAAMVEDGADQGPWLRLLGVPLDVGLEIAARTEDPAGRAYGLAALLPDMSPAERAAAGAEIEALFCDHIDEFLEDFSYAGAFENLSRERRLRIIRRLFEAQDEDSWKLAAVREIAWSADDDVAEELLRAVRSMSEETRGDALILVAPCIPTSLIDAYLVIADSLSGWDLAASLGALARHHVGPWVQRALSLCREGDFHPSIRAPILVDLCAGLTDDERLELEPLLLSDLNAPVDTRAWDEHDPDWLLGDFAESFMNTRPAETLRLLGEINNDDVVATLAARCITTGPSDIRDHALAALDALEDPHALVNGYGELVARSNDAERDEHLETLCRLAISRGLSPILVSMAVTRGWELNNLRFRAVVNDALAMRRVQDWHELGDAATALGREASAAASSDAMILMSRIGYDIPIGRIAFAFADKFSRRQQERIIAAVKTQPDALMASSLLDDVYAHLPHAIRADVVAWTTTLPESGDQEIEAKARFMDICLPSDEAGSALESEWERLVDLLPEAKRATVRRSVRRRVAGPPLAGWRQEAVLKAKATPWSRKDIVDKLVNEDRHAFHMDVWLDRIAALGRAEKCDLLIEVLREVGDKDRKIALITFGRLAPTIRDVGGATLVDQVLSVVRENDEAWG